MPGLKLARTIAIEIFRATEKSNRSPVPRYRPLLLRETRDDPLQSRAQGQEQAIRPFEDYRQGKGLKQAAPKVEGRKARPQHGKSTPARNNLSRGIADMKPL